MGTRNLTCAVVNGEYKVAQYGQWDGYPDGQGITILDFLRVTNLDILKNQIVNCTYFADDELEELWTAVVGTPDEIIPGFVDKAQSDMFYRQYPHLSRDVAGKIFSHIYNEDGYIKLKNGLEFAADSLFCEWAYVVDFDKQTFEVYKGWNKIPLTEEDRFYNLTQFCDAGYYPVKLVASFPLDNLPPDNESFITFFVEEDVD